MSNSPAGRGSRAPPPGSARPPIAILALEKENRRRPLLGIRQRIEGGRQFLLLRACAARAAGITARCGRSATSRKPYPETTGMALAALRGVRAPQVERAIAVARQFLTECRSADAQNWLRLGLIAQGHLPAGYCRPQDLSFRTVPEISLDLLMNSSGRNLHPRMTSPPFTTSDPAPPDAASAALSGCARHAPVDPSTRLDRSRAAVRSDALSPGPRDPRGAPAGCPRQTCRAQAEPGRVRARKHINTNPLLVHAAYEAFRAMGAASVEIAEGPGHRRNTLDLADAAGYFHTVPGFEDRFTDLNLDDVTRFRPKRQFSRLGKLYLPNTVLGADLLVSMPKMKTHHWTGATLSMKNLFGVVPGGVYGWPKNVLHWSGIHECIADLHSLLPAAVRAGGWDCRHGRKRPDPGHSQARRRPGGRQRSGSRGRHMLPHHADRPLADRLPQPGRVFASRRPRSGAATSSQIGEPIAQVATTVRTAAGFPEPPSGSMSRRWTELGRARRYAARLAAAARPVLLAAAPAGRRPFQPHL